MTTDSPRVLIIDDDRQVRGLLLEILCKDHNCSEAGSAEEGLAALRADKFDLVLSDINMAGMSGLELVPHILQTCPDAVVIMISGEQTIETAIAAMRVGAFDYMTKPLEVDHVEAVVKRALNHYQLLKEKQRYKEQLEKLLRERTAEVDHLAHYDTRTGLPNRALFEDRLSQALTVAYSNGQSVGILFLALDQFKKVNDTFGHDRGDCLLKAVGERLKSCVTQQETVGRFGDDDFAVLLHEVNGQNDVVDVIATVTQALAAPFEIDGQPIFVTASVGASIFPIDGKDSQTLLKNAGAALYRAKTSGGDNYQFFTPDLHVRASKRFALETNLRRALDNNEFVLHYQPRVAVDTLRITGTEVLVRWEHPELGLISPSEFIPLAEDTGLVIPIGEWVLHTACEQNRKWQDEGFEAIRVAVNISGRQFHQPDIGKLVVRALDHARLGPEHLELELTESSIMSNAEFAVNALTVLKDMGVRISVDDFGTGFSSLSYLKRLPIHALKIDQSFVRDAPTDPDDAAIVMAVIMLGHNLRLEVVAEGVETDEQLRFLSLLRCDQIQGDLFSPPLPADKFVRLLNKAKVQKELRAVSDQQKARI